MRPILLIHAHVLPASAPLRAKIRFLIIVAVRYPDFSDSPTRTGTVIVVLVGLLVLAAPFAARAVVSNPAPQAEPVSAGSVTLVDAHGTPLVCPRTENRPAQDDTGVGGMWTWDCANDVKASARVELSPADGEAPAALTRYFWQMTSGEDLRPDDIAHPAPHVAVGQRGDIAAASVQRGDTTTYFSASGGDGVDLISRLAAEEAMRQ